VARDDLFTAPDVAGHLASLRKGSSPERSGDVLSRVKPFHLRYSDAEGTSHGTPYSYDSQVPVVFVGKGIDFGAYLEEMNPVDVAPTVAALMVAMPLPRRASRARKCSRGSKPRR